MRHTSSAPAAFLLLASFAVAAVRAQPDASPGGLFTGHRDVGDCAHPGAVAYDEARRRYPITGGGPNWTRDETRLVRLAQP